MSALRRFARSAAGDQLQFGKRLTLVVSLTDGSTANFVRHDTFSLH